MALKPLAVAGRSCTTSCYEQNTAHTYAVIAATAYTVEVPGTATVGECAMVDFQAMLAGKKQAAPTEPRELHSLLKKRQGYGYLRDVQAQVLTAWDRRRDQRDLVVKVNTGGGKTIDGLIILQSYINEGLGPALYVAPTNMLVGQVVAEAERLGIETTRDVDSAEYLRGEAIGVINIYELVNGRSKFSDRRVSRSPAPIGSVVIDDAHAALATSRTQLSLSLPRENEGFDQLLQLFEQDLKGQSPEALLDVQDDRRGSPARVPFWAWRQKLDDARQILRSQSGNGSDGEALPLFFRWPAVADTLQWCRVAFSNREVTITPHCTPINHVTSFAEAKRRVFLTATLSDDSTLVTDFGADPESVQVPITPLTAGDIGERMILAPQEICPGLPSETARESIAELATEYNTVVLVPSKAASAAWEPYASRVAVGDDVEDAVDELRSNPSVGLVVLVNRYDGIDLPESACRVLVLDGLPESFSPEDRLESVINRGTAIIASRQVQRLEQGMGRGVRSNEDHCVVLLLGPRLAQLVADPRTVDHFTPATRAQLELSRTVALQIGDHSMTGVLEAARQALSRDPDWVQLALESLRGIPPQGGTVRQSAIGRRLAFDSALDDDLRQSVTILKAAAEAEVDAQTRGALLELQACYEDVHDPEKAQATLSEARALNNRVTKPLNGVVYHRIKQVSPQAEACAAMLQRTFVDRTLLRLSFEQVASDLAFESDRVEEFEESFRFLGKLIGLGSQRPEQDTQVGPDNLWALDDNRFWVIEAKTGATSPAIGKRDMAQLSQSMEWFRRYYDRKAVGVPVMIHQATAAYANASPVPDMQIMTEPLLEDLASSVRSFAAALSNEGWGDAERIARLLRGHKLDVDSLSDYLTPQRGVYRH